ncbi:hypothetical protein ROZALSC1DRAFT_22951 [Rozella allomycis CSF55]|nr:hypothetical protein ROZALSC1DRAFT_22951 [Rozella allomycis CSF55]
MKSVWIITALFILICLNTIEGQPLELGDEGVGEPLDWDWDWFYGRDEKKTLIKSLKSFVKKAETKMKEIKQNLKSEKNQKRMKNVKNAVKLAKMFLEQLPEVIRDIPIDVLLL